jgi:hypothetical protein
MHACLAELVQRRVQSQQPVQLFAEAITLTATVHVQKMGTVRPFDGLRAGSEP